MPEPCRNFQRGSCRYGDRCKFSHATQQQQKPNSFGFGSQTGSPFQQQSGQQQKPNSFGFGAKNNIPANGSGGFKPFENKWIRPGQPANQSQANQSQSANHECKDPAVCKRLMTEDFQNERPLWKLTCYAHYKHLPCDISGDISYEELRAEAYNGAKSGLSIQAIVEREKNLEKSKLAEYENMLRNPYTQHAQSVQSNPSPFPTVGTTFPSPTPQNTGPSPFSGFLPQQGSSPNMTFGIPQQGSSPNTTFPSPTPQNTAPPAFASFSQQGSSPNMSFGVRPSTPSNNAFAPFHSSGPFGSTSAPSGPFGTHVSTPTGGNSFPAQTTGNSFPVQTSANPLASNTTIFGNGGMNSQGNQTHVQTGGNAFASNIPPFSNSGLGIQGGIPPSSLPVSSQQNHTPVISQSSVLSNGLTGTISLEQRHMVQNEVLSADEGIWLKEEWKIGEIPELPPPAQYVK